MADVEIGVAKSGRRAYGLDEVAIVPSRRTRDAADVDVSFQLDAFQFPVPVLAAALDAVVSPSTATALGGLGALGVLNLEGLWTRYEDPEPLLAEIATLEPSSATPRLQELYAEPVKRTLVVERIQQLGASGMVTCAALRPQRCAELASAILEGELDVLVIQGTVVSAEHVASSGEPLNLSRFIRELDIPIVVGDCSSYQTALHVMRTGAIGVLVGAGSGGLGATRAVLGMGTPQASAIADVAGARSRHLEETGVYVQVVADSEMSQGGELAKAIACGADAVMIGSALAAATEAPGRGRFWASSAVHPELPRGGLGLVEEAGTLAEILLGPGRDGSGRLNLVGALRSAMALCGYASIREFHKADLVVTSPRPGRDTPRSAFDLIP